LEVADQEQYGIFVGENHRAGNGWRHFEFRDVEGLLLYCEEVNELEAKLDHSTSNN
jgi:hypothetical protein